jgi:hypothetical protein
METMKAIRVHEYGGPEVEAVFPLNEARRAQELSQTGHARGKIVLEVA